MNLTKTKPVIFIIFGATGDLNWRKINPALFNLFLEGYLPEKFTIISTGRKDISDDEFRAILLEGLKKNSRKKEFDIKKWESFSSNITYHSADINEDDTFLKIGKIVNSFEKKWEQEAIRVFYMAVASQFFSTISQGIKKNKLAESKENSRIVIEKPFGRDLVSAKSLNNLLCSLFDENQIYRIDHYLGKETVQNILAFRFANAIFEPIWNRNFIQHIQISVSEQLGVGKRGQYYETSGALRDMVQNHILQLLSLVAMEPPVSFEANEIRNKKVDVLRSMRPFKAEELKSNVVRGQYGEGWLEGEKVVGYRQEEQVAQQSNTETFAALKFYIDNWRWHGIPFYVRTGKRMHKSASVISIQFKDVPHQFFSEESVDNWKQNRLIISIQPEMSIRLQVQSKKPGLEMQLNTVDMVFDYNDIENQETPEAYETLLLDAITGDQTLFMRGDQVEAAWELLMPVVNLWESKQNLDFPNYAADSWGPEAAEALIAKDGFHWFSLKTK